MKRIFRITGILTAVFFICGCSRQPEQSVLTQTAVAMGTVVQESIYAKEGKEAAAEEVLEIINALEQDTLSRRLESAEVYQLNHWSSEEREQHLLSKKLGKALQQCLEIWQTSEGALDITLAPVIQCWDIDDWAGEEGTAYPVPSKEEIAKLLLQCGCDKIKLEETESGYTLSLQEGVMIDMGAVGKGMALDEIRTYLEGQDTVEGAVVSVGGSVLTFGKKPDNTPWRVAIIDPVTTTGQIGYVSLTGNLCVSTSGDYERYVEADGVRYHHILDPKTGEPARSGVRSVTIVSSSGFVSDALSTACFVLGAQKGCALAESYGAEALFVTEEGEIVMTEGMKQYFTAE